MNRLNVAALLLLIAACTSSPPSRYAHQQDHGPDQAVDLSHVPDAIPRIEPRSRGGNYSPYVVNGRSYQVLDNSLGFREQGVASWYGNKFHGYRTSNGEIYDMYAMTAAHKHLPLPSYVRVTNLDNQRQVVVRVNDRGPFHEGRVIDLSYAAAFKLGMLQRGTARVMLEALDPRAFDNAATTPLPGVAVTLWQVGAFSSRDAAERVKQRLGTLLPPEAPVTITTRTEGKPLYRVRFGPLPSPQLEPELEQRLQAAGLPPVPVVDLP